jgi:hypothetical protein
VVVDRLGTTPINWRKVLVGASQVYVSTIRSGLDRNELAEDTGIFEGICFFTLKGKTFPYVFHGAIPETPLFFPKDWLARNVPSRLRDQMFLSFNLPSVRIQEFTGRLVEIMPRAWSPDSRFEIYKSTDDRLHVWFDTPKNPGVRLMSAPLTPKDFLNRDVQVTLLLRPGLNKLLVNQREHDQYPKVIASDFKWSEQGETMRPQFGLVIR